MDKKCFPGLAIHVRGIVQGVGFRPFVYKLAMENHLKGWVKNTSNGVEIEIFGLEDNLDAFKTELLKSPPPLARIDSFTANNISGNGYTQFNIIESSSESSQFIPVSPDISTCSDCLAEMQDKNNRRYHYPFINCTNCGPRFTIVKDIPYDRPLTTMSGFSLCPACREEYENPVDRRFHAQPTACPVCGPELSFLNRNTRISGNETSLIAARQSIIEGNILAIKGLGGFHLACDAANQSAVQKLRERKHRVEKPFALMALSVSLIEKYCHVSLQEKALLESRQRPIVLLNKRDDCSLPVALAPGQKTLGFMLPYTPLHYLLLEESPNFPEILVMTSGNSSDEPIAFEDKDASNRLAPLADGFLTHNRGIHLRVDDSVMRVVDGRSIFVRRSRGYAPDPLTLPFESKPVLAVGAELKNHFTFTRETYAFHSHYIGDLENYETLQSFEQGIHHFENLFRINPEILACDLHPDYLSTRYAQARSQQENIPLVQVQHHHAHLAACLIDNNWNSDESVIGLTFDGTGFGTDGTIWGGEILLGGYKQYQRRFHLEPFKLPGGDKSTRFPARIALSLLQQYGLDWENDLPPVEFFNNEELNVIRSQIVNNINTPTTSSMGRLFDAISALIGVRQQVSYEGQAAIELEALCDPYENGGYSIELHNDIIRHEPLFRSVLKDLHQHTPREIIAARFHNSIVQMCLETCKKIRQETGTSVVALSGGVWQNVFLLNKTFQMLKSNKFTVLVHKNLPSNDACISMGQAVIAAKITR